MLEKLEKLLKGKDPENIKLANHLIDTTLNKDSIIAVICLLRMLEIEDILSNKSTTELIVGILQSCDNRVNRAPEPMELRNYRPKDLYELSLNHIRSKVNINYATKYYIEYIQRLSEDANRILLDEELANEAFEV